MPYYYDRLLNEAQILSERAAELGILTYDDTYVIASTRDRFEVDQKLSPEEEATLAGVISTLLQRLAPENLASIIRRKRSSYKVTLFCSAFF